VKRGFKLVLRIVLTDCFLLEDNMEKNKSRESDNVRVIVRCRPMNPTETESSCTQVVMVSTLHCRQCCSGISTSESIS